MAPQVVAHRGASDELPEHTLAAYRRAIEVGAPALECDIRLTADGQLVCVHDRSLMRTSNGIGAVSAMTLQELQAFDWGSWQAELKGGEAHPQAVLTLDALLSLIADTDRRVELAIETKHPTRSGKRVELALTGLLERYGWSESNAEKPSPIRLMSFSWLSVRRMSRLTPQLPLVYLMDHLWWPYRDGALPAGVTAVGIDVKILRSDREYVERVKRRGHQVHVWTVNQPDDVALCLDLGVDVIITDRAEWVMSRISGRD